jgi:hypothetical protein
MRQLRRAFLVAPGPRRQEHLLLLLLLHQDLLALMCSLLTGYSLLLLLCISTNFDNLLKRDWWKEPDV